MIINANNNNNKLTVIAQGIIIHSCLHIMLFKYTNMWHIFVERELRWKGNVWVMSSVSL